MTNQNQALAKTFDNPLEDYGKVPLGLAYVTDEPTYLGVGYVFMTLIGLAFGGAPGALFTLLIGANDVIFRCNNGKTIEEDVNVSQDTNYSPGEPEPAMEQRLGLPAVAPVGATTQLQAVDVTATEVCEANRRIGDSPEVVEPTAPRKPAKTALDVITASYVSRAFFGAQRTGKSYLAAVCSRQMAHRDGAKVYYINLLSAASMRGAEENQYTAHATRSVIGDLSSCRDSYQASALIQEALELVYLWWEDSSKSILIVDEWTYISAKDGEYAGEIADLIKLIAGKQAALASSGMKRSQCIWAISPNLVAGNLLDPGKVIKSLALTYVTIPPGKTVDWNGQAVGFDAGLYKQLTNNYAPFDLPYFREVGNHERMVYVNGEWLPTGVTGTSLQEIPAVKNDHPVVTSAEAILAAGTIKQSSKHQEVVKEPVAATVSKATTQVNPAWNNLLAAGRKAGSPLVPLMEFMESKDTEEFSLKKLVKVTTLVDKIGNSEVPGASKADKIRAVVYHLAGRNLLSVEGDTVKRIY